MANGPRNAEETLQGFDDVTLRGGKKCEEIDTVEMLNV